jgi:16S rRNA C967 or C1407 C5-methylase (RsmB/RsmF family)
MTDDEGQAFFARINYLEKTNESLCKQLADIKREWATADSHKEDYAEKLEQQLAECQAQRLLELESVRHFAWQHGHGETVRLLDEKLGGTPTERLRKKAKELK